MTYTLLEGLNVDKYMPNGVKQVCTTKYILITLSKLLKNKYINCYLMFKCNYDILNVI